MTDRELVLELCKRLHLTPEDGITPSDYGYCERPELRMRPKSIIIGQGDGNDNHCAIFYFHEDGTLKSHGIWE
jgi:hypothetical protein